MARPEEKHDIPKPVVSDIYDVSPEFLKQNKVWLEQAGLNVPVSQLQGSANVPLTSPTTQDVIDALVALNLVVQTD